MTKELRILLAEDHCLVRAGFRALLESLEHVSVVAEAENGTEALELIDHVLPRYRPYGYCHAGLKRAGSNSPGTQNPS